LRQLHPACLLEEKTIFSQLFTSTKRAFVLGSDRLNSAMQDCVGVHQSLFTSEKLICCTLAFDILSFDTNWRLLAPNGCVLSNQIKFLAV
jgi:hypothetical protein